MPAQEPEPRPRAPQSRTAEALDLLRRNRDFRLMFFAQLISLGGDWFLSVALFGLVFEFTGSPALVSALIATMSVPYALMTFVGGPLADRIDRRRLMVASDVVRGVLAFGFFFVTPSTVWLAFVLVGVIQSLGAFFEPAAAAAVPNLVEPEDLPVANVLTGSLWGTMLAVGAALGGVVVAAFGREAGYIGDAASFLVSAALIVRIHGRFAEARENVVHPGLFEATRETVSYARRDTRVASLIAVKAGFGLGTGLIGLLPVLSFTVYSMGDRGSGILYGFRGLGALLGPFLARPFIRDRDLRSLFAAISVCLAVYGIFYGVVPWMPTIWLAGVFVMLAHLGGGGQWTLSTYGLQLIVPDRIRGRVLAFDDAMITFTLAVSSLLAGWAAEYVRVEYVMVGLAAVELLFAIVWTIATRRVGRLPVGPAGQAATPEEATREEATGAEERAEQQPGARPEPRMEPER
jgi:MFS family permease